MNDFFSAQNNTNSTTNNAMENWYPEMYHTLYPMVFEAVNNMERQGQTLTPDMLNSMIDNILINSGMWDEDESMDMNPAIPAQGFMPFRRGRRGHHNRNTLRDLLRILFLREFAGRGRRDRF